MAKVRGGDILELSINNRLFEPVTGSNVVYRLSGFTNETTPTGNGGEHTVQRRKLGGFDSLPISVDPDKGDVEALQAAADAGEPVDCYMTLAGGQTYRGKLTIQDVVDANTGDGQVEITALGAKFEQI
jgi:hypothetical protein